MNSEWINPCQLSLADKFSVWKRHVKCSGFKKYVQMFIFQRIFRINSAVPWPVHSSSIVSGSKNIKYKAWHAYRPNLGLSTCCYIQAMYGIEVGINVRIASGVKIISANHDVNDYDKHIPASPVKIGDNVWLGANSVLLPGVEIGDHTVVAAGAVVNRSFKEGNCILAGMPAKIVKKLPVYEKN